MDGGKNAYELIKALDIVEPSRGEDRLLPRTEIRLIRVAVEEVRDIHGLCARAAHHLANLAHKSGREQREIVNIAVIMLERIDVPAFKIMVMVQLRYLENAGAAIL